MINIIIDYNIYKEYAGGTVFEEVSANKKVTQLSDWRKVSGGQMVNIYTGEVKDIIRSETKGDNLRSVAISLNKGKDYALNNFCNKKKVYSIDFTYSYEQKWYDKFTADLKKLVKNIQKINKDVKIIIFKEVNQNGVYHGHMLLTDADITEAMFRELWTEGDEIKFSIMKSDRDVIRKVDYLTNISGNNRKSMKKRNAYKNFPSNKRLYYKTSNLDTNIKITNGKLDKTNLETVLKTPDEKASKTGISYGTYIKPDDKEYNES